MESVSVIEHEVEYLTKLIKTIKDKDERDYYNDKVDSLKFKKDTIESNVGNGYVSPQSYIKTVTQYLAKTEKDLKAATASLGKGNKHTKRIEERVAIIKKEIKEMQEGLEGAQNEPKPDVVMKEEKASEL